MQELITTSDKWNEAGRGNAAAIWWIVEFNPNYLDGDNQFDLVRNQLLKHPLDFTKKLDEGEFRIWTGTPAPYVTWDA